MGKETNTEAGPFMTEQEQQANFKLILQSLEQLNSRQVNTEEQLIAIGKALNKIALQQKDIDTLSGRVDAVWKKMDSLLSVDGIITKIKSHQESCPRDTITEEMKTLKTDVKDSLFFHVKILWGGIGFILLIMVALKLFG